MFFGMPRNQPPSGERLTDESDPAGVGQVDHLPLSRRLRIVLPDAAVAGPHITHRAAAGRHRVVGIAPGHVEQKGRPNDTPSASRSISRSIQTRRVRNGPGGPSIRPEPSRSEPELSRRKALPMRSRERRGPPKRPCHRPMRGGPPRGMGHVLTKSLFFVFSQSSWRPSSEAFANTIAPLRRERLICAEPATPRQRADP